MLVQRPAVASGGYQIGYRSMTSSNLNLSRPPRSLATTRTSTPSAGTAFLCNARQSAASEEQVSSPVEGTRLSARRGFVGQEPAPARGLSFQFR